MKCKVIQDLLPLYAEQLTSEESSELIEAHLRDCEDCTKFYEGIKERPQTALLENDRDIKPMKKVKRSFVIRLTAGILGSVLLMTAAFFFLFWGVIPIHSDKLNIQMELAEKEDGRKSLCINFTGDCGCIMERTSMQTVELSSDSTVRHYDITIYPVLCLPFDNRGEYPNQFEWSTDLPREGSMDKDVTITIHCLDQDITYDVLELAAMLEDAED